MFDIYLCIPSCPAKVKQPIQQSRFISYTSLQMELLGLRNNCHSYLIARSQFAEVLVVARKTSYTHPFSSNSYRWYLLFLGEKTATLFAKVHFWSKEKAAICVRCLRDFCSQKHGSHGCETHGFQGFGVFFIGGCGPLLGCERLSHATRWRSWRLRPLTFRGIPRYGMIYGILFGLVAGPWKCVKWWC